MLTLLRCPPALLRRPLPLLICLLLLAACASAPTRTGGRSAELDPPARPTATPEPDIPTPPTPTTAPQPPTLLRSGFGQRGRAVGYGFVVQNPDSRQTLADSRYTLDVYDQAGALLGSDSGYINALGPGQALGMAGRAMLEQDAHAARIVVSLEAGQYEPAEPLPAFEVAQLAYQENGALTQVTGEIHNASDRELAEVRASVLAYDQAGAIIGSGFTFVNFIPAQGTSALVLSLDSSAAPARLELYPTLSSLSDALVANEVPLSPTLLKQGYGQERAEVGIGFLVRNPDGARAIERAQYRAAVYAQDGGVLGVEEGTIDLLMPGQTLGVATNVYVPRDARVARLLLQLRAGRAAQAPDDLLLRTDSATYQLRSGSAWVTGMLASNYARTVTNIRLSALLYDNAGAIIGAGYTFEDAARARSRTEIELPVAMAGTPAKVEIYPTLSSLSEFEEE